jgi:hypothetical protein
VRTAVELAPCTPFLFSVQGRAGDFLSRNDRARRWREIRLPVIPSLLLPTSYPVDTCS